MNNINKILYGIANENIRIGEIRPFSGSNAPSKWKICNGDVISRTIYSKLFSVIGTTYGGGDGAATFAIPDTRGRNIINIGESTATGHTNHVLGETGGEESHALTTAELANHNHPNNGHGYQDNDNSSGCQPLSARYFPNDPWSGAWTKYTGSNNQHNTMQPYAVCTYIIYTGVLEV